MIVGEPCLLHLLWGDWTTVSNSWRWLLHAEHLRSQCVTSSTSLLLHSLAHPILSHHPLQRTFGLPSVVSVHSLCAPRPVVLCMHIYDVVCSAYVHASNCVFTLIFVHVRVCACNHMRVSTISQYAPILHNHISSSPSSLSSLRGSAIPLPWRTQSLGCFQPSCWVMARPLVMRGSETTRTRWCVCGRCPLLSESNTNWRRTQQRL